MKTASQSDYVRLVEKKFRPILHDLESEVINSGLFEPKVVYGYFPAQSDGNDVIVYSAPNPESRAASENSEMLRFTFPRQKEGRRLSIADFFAPKSSGKMDVIGLSLVTIGSKASAETQRLFEGGEYTKYLYLHGSCSVETAEALAELHHKNMREELGIASEDSVEIRDLFHQKYRGSRYSFGYPACPNLEDQTKLFALFYPGRKCWRPPDFRLLARTGAVDLGDRGASSGCEVFCGMKAGMQITETITADGSGFWGYGVYKIELKTRFTTYTDSSRKNARTVGRYDRVFHPTTQIRIFARLIPTLSDRNSSRRTLRSWRFAKSRRTSRCSSRCPIR